MRDTYPDFQLPNAHDELKYQRRHDLMQDLSRETITFRNNRDETALPMRYLGSFKPGEGVGGAGVHWGAQTWRFLPWDFETRSRTVARYGKSQIAEDCTSQDWGVTYDELEPHFTKFEYLYGVSGKAGNLDGKIIPGGNPFEGRRSREYPLPPMKTTHAGALFTKAAASLGYKPFPTPVATPSAVYTNPYGVTMNACVYCGYCEGFACEVAAKASPQTTVLPVLMKNTNFELRTLCNVTGVNLDAGEEARGERDLRGLARARVRAARRAGAALLLRPQQRAPDAAVGHRQALRPGRRIPASWDATTPTRRRAA